MVKNVIIGFLRGITGYNDLLLRNEYLVSEIENRESIIKDIMKNWQDLSLELEELENKYELSKQQISDLLKKETLDILELKSWYEGRRNQTPWIYNGNRLGSQDVKEYLKVKDIKPFTDLANEVINRYKLTKDNSATEIITGMYRYWNLRSSWTYITDMVQYGQVEWWESPDEALKKRRGDCESKAKCMYWTGVEMLRLLGKEEHDWRLTFWATHVLVEGGHALNSWLGDSGEYYAVESTYDENNSFYKTWLRTPVRFNNLYYGNPWGFATKTKSWRGSNSALLSFRDPEVNT